MDPDELRDELQGIAARAPRGTAGARDAVLDRGRLLLRRRRMVQAGTALVAVVAVAGGFTWWQSGGSPRPKTVIATPSTLVPTTRTTAVTPTTTKAPPSAPLTSVAPTTTTVAPPPTGEIRSQTGYLFLSAPVISGHSLYAIETRYGGRGPANDRWVARVDLDTRAVVRVSDQPGATALVVAGGYVWVGEGTGTGAAFGTPADSHVRALDPTDLTLHRDVTLPGSGTNGLVAAAGSVWALSDDTVVRIDAASASIADTIPLVLPTVNPYRTLAVSADGTRLYVGWATQNQTEGVGEFDAKTGTKRAENAQVGRGPANVGPALSLAGSRLWATFATGTEAEAVALRASDLTPTGDRVGGPNSLLIAPTGNVVWASRDATLDCVTPHDHTLVSHSPTYGVGSAALPTPTAVYVTTATANGSIAVYPADPACPSS